MSYKITKSRADKIRKLVKKANDSLYRLEKAGLVLDSSEYRMVNYYAVDKADKHYNVDTKRGTIRFSADMSRITSKQDAMGYENILNNFLNAKTRTVSGTREAIKKGYEKFKEKLKITKSPYKAEEFDYTKYRRLWQIFRINVIDDKKQKMASDDVFNIITSSRGFYDMDEDSIAKAFQYYNKMSVDEATDQIYEDYEDLF